MVDTCCIDKTSSAELSEAINSMWRWYKESRVCYAYLSDAESNLTFEEEDFLAECRWFTRSWTLQELLAPGIVVFYDKHWKEIGTASTLADRIARVTRIPSELLSGPRTIADYSVAARLSWAARRDSTRTEDRAYSLLGMFNINMPLLYGEGSRAFERLQRKIIKYSQDLSIFAWSRSLESYHEPEQWVHWLLANSLEDFAELDSIEQRWYDVDKEIEIPSDSQSRVVVTPREVTLYLYVQKNELETGEMLAYLGCLSSKSNSRLCLHLVRCTDGSWRRTSEIVLIKRDAEEITTEFQLTCLKSLRGTVRRSPTLPIFPKPVPPLTESILPTVRIYFSPEITKRRLEISLQFATNKSCEQTMHTGPKMPPTVIYGIDQYRTDWMRHRGASVGDLTITKGFFRGVSVVATPDNVPGQHKYYDIGSTLSIVMISIHDGNACIMSFFITTTALEQGSRISMVPVPCGSGPDSLRWWDPCLWSGRSAHEYSDLLVAAYNSVRETGRQIRAQVRPRGCNLHSNTSCSCQYWHVHITTERIPERIGGLIEDEPVSRSPSSGTTICQRTAWDESGQMDCDSRSRPRQDKDDWQIRYTLAKRSR